MDLLLGLAQERKKTLLVVTHDNNLAQRGDRTLRTVDGLLPQRSARARFAGLLLLERVDFQPLATPVVEFTPG